MGGRARPVAHRQPGARARGRATVVVGHRDRHVDRAGPGRHSTASRCAVATPLVSPCSSAITASTCPTPRWRGWSPSARGDHLFRSKAVRTPEGLLSFVYKAAAEIGELGDNTATMRADILADDLLRLALAGERASAVVLGHTRWASIGIISQPNAHPVDSLEVDGPGGPYVTAALNGDVDNFADLKAADGLRLAAEITTDAKVIPTLVSHRLAEGADLTTAFRDTVATFEGSVAIGASAATHPDHLLLALRGSGQALYVGLADGCYVVASEPYGLVELTSTYLRLDGDTPANPENPNASRGQIVVLDGSAGRHPGRHHPPGLRRHRPAGHRRRPARGPGHHPRHRPGRPTRTSSSRRSPRRPPASARPCAASSRTATGSSAVALGEDVLSPAVREGLRSGRIGRIQVIGQGTAHVAGQSLASALVAAVPDGRVRVEALPATELSGFGLRADMSDTLVVAISQSGTTTDTNRTVDLVRDRGASVLAIVNRRSSDLTDKADGVLYTSDGRDVEMSVASTKAFYSQIAAGFLLAWAIAEEVGGTVRPEAGGARCATCPTRWRLTVARRADIAVAAQQLAPAKRYWAIVGNGTNRIAAEELRIKLCELCYKVDRLRRHRGQEAHRPVVRAAHPRVRRRPGGLHRRRRRQGGGDLPRPQGGADRHRHRGRGPVRRGAPRDLRAGRRTRRWPSCCPRWPATCSATRRRWPSTPRPARSARPAPRSRMRSASTWRPTATSSSLAPAGARRVGHPVLRRPAQRGVRRPPRGQHRGAPRVLYRYALGIAPLEAYQAELGRIGTPAVVVDDLTAALTQGIEELTRPVDAIKHQAKTVTVGHLAERRDAAPAAARAGGPRGRRRARPAQLQDAAHAGRPRPGRRRGHRLDPLRARRRSRRRRGAGVDRRPGRHRARHPVAHRAQPGCSGAPSTPWPSSARCSSPAGREDGRTVVIVPGDQGRPGHRHHPAARAVPRPPAACPPRAARCRATGTGGPRCATRSRRPSRPSARTSSPRCPTADLLVSRSATWPTAGARSPA